MLQSVEGFPLDWVEWLGRFSEAGRELGGGRGAFEGVGGLRGIDRSTEARSGGGDG